MYSISFFPYFSQIRFSLCGASTPL
jgi:hypothetical protein